MTLKESLQIVDSPFARPWQREGWGESVLQWLSAVLPGEIRLEAVNAHDLACVMRFQTGAENVYFKCGYNSREPIVTARLAGLFPNFVPNVIAHNPEQNWLLTKDAGEYLSFSSDLNHWKASLSALATFHQAEGQLFDGLELAFHPFAGLANRGEAFLRDAPVLRAWGLTDEQIEGLEQLLPSLHTALERVQALALSECFYAPRSYAFGFAPPRSGLSQEVLRLARRDFDNTTSIRSLLVEVTAKNAHSRR